MSTKSALQIILEEILLSGGENILMRLEEKKAMKLYTEYDS